MRLQSYLSHCGIASRRACAKLINEGRASVNGTCTREPGHPVDPSKDAVTFDGQPLQPPEGQTTLMLYKPAGYVCSRNGQSAPTVFELLDGDEPRLVCVGRLDKASEGLLILSSDGQLVNQLTHPRHGHHKTYHVTVQGNVAAGALQCLRSPLLIDGYRIRPVTVRIMEAADNTTQLEFILREGRNQQIRKMCQMANLTVLRLLRTQIGDQGLGKLKPGQWRTLNNKEIAALTRDTAPTPT